jgi:hypothetical protein
VRVSALSPCAPAQALPNRYTAVKAELDKAELEQDALLEALRETCLTLADVRSQWDNLNAEVRREKQFTALSKQVCDPPFLTASSD